MMDEWVNAGMHGHAAYRIEWNVHIDPTLINACLPACLPACLLI